MTKDEALELCDYLECNDASLEAQCKAAAFIREALAQPAQEPVAWGYRNHDGAIYDCISPEAHADAEGDYTVPLYTAPPQRPWVGLTNAEIEDCIEMSIQKTCRAIESKLKEKNFD